jgi:type VI secretion system protein ImpK
MATEHAREGARPSRPGPRLLWEADALLAVIPQLRATALVPDLALLHERLTTLLRDFHARARRDGIEPARVELATEVIAAVFDQVVTTMPWGTESGWRSLGAAPVPVGGRPSAAHATQRLMEVARRSFADAGMRELIGVALSLGIEGTPGADDVQVSQLRAQLAADASQDRAALAHALAPPAPGTVQRRSPLGSWLTLWVSSAAVAALLAMLYFALQVSLGAKSDALYARIMHLNAPIARAVPSLPAPQPRMARLLSASLASRHVVVRDELDRSLVVVPGMALFEPDSNALRPGGTALLRPIAAALGSLPGRIQIIGHTGGGSQRSVRYPSEWDLSVDRARTVLDSLHQLGLASARMTADGRGAIDPPAGWAGQDSGDGRVEIVLLAGR